MVSSGLLRRVALVRTTRATRRNNPEDTILQHYTFVQMSVHIYTTRRYVPEDGDIRDHRCDNFKYHKRIDIEEEQRNVGMK
jgi:hypothetical protein